MKFLFDNVIYKFMVNGLVAVLILLLVLIRRCERPGKAFELFYENVLEEEFAASADENMKGKNENPRMCTPPLFLSNLDYYRGNVWLRLQTLSHLVLALEKLNKCIDFIMSLLKTSAL